MRGEVGEERGKIVATCTEGKRIASRDAVGYKYRNETFECIDLNIELCH